MIRMILSIAMAFLSLLLRNIVSIVFILIAMMMVLFTIVKSKRDDDRKKRNGLRVTPTKRFEGTSPPIGNVTSSNDNSNNDSNSPHTPFNNVKVRFDLDTPINNNDDSIIEEIMVGDIDFDELHSPSYNNDDNGYGGGWGLDDDDWTKLGLIYDKERNYDNEYIDTNDNYANRYILNYNRHKITSPSPSTKTDQHNTAAAARIKDLDKSVEQKLYDLEQRMKAEAEFLKIKTDEERQKFKVEKQKEEERMKEREKLAEEMKKVMKGSNSSRNSEGVNTIDFNKPLNVVIDTALDVVRMKTLYAQCRGIVLKATVSPSFNDIFKMFEAFHNDVEALFSRLEEVRNQIQVNSGKNFHELGTTKEVFNVMSASKESVFRALLEHFTDEMKEDVMELFQTYKIIISRLQHESLIHNFQELIKNKKGKNIQYLDSASMKVELPVELTKLLEEAKVRIETLNDSSKRNSDEFKDDPNADENIICDTVLNLENVILKAAKTDAGPQGFRKALLMILEYTIAAVKACNSVHEIPAFAFIVYGIFRTLPQQHKQKVSEIIRSFLALHSDLINKVISSESAQNPDSLDFDGSNNRSHQENVLAFFGVLVASNEQYPVNVSDGWSYVVKGGKAFSRYITNSKSADKLQHAKHYCTALTLSLRTFGKALRAQVPKHKDLLDTILLSMKNSLNLEDTDEGKALIAVISQLKATGNQSVAKDSHSSFIEFKNQQPIIMKKRLIIRECHDIKAIVKVINDEKKTNNFLKDACNKIGKIGGFLNTFNSVDDVKGRNGIIAKIREVLAEACSDDRLENYAYVIIAKAMINDKIEAEQFINTDPKNTFKYALLTHELCKLFPKLQVVIKSQFYERCQLTIPIISDTDQGTDWENKVMNVLSTYAVIVTYLGSPFNIKEGWNLLASFVNYYSDPLVKTIPSYVITALDIFIGIAGEYLYKNYDQQKTTKLQKMIKYLKLLNTTIIPKCSADKIKNLHSLQEKIKSVINSNGSTWIGFYNNNEELEQLKSSLAR